MHENAGPSQLLPDRSDCSTQSASNFLYVSFLGAAALLQLLPTLYKNAGSPTQ